MLFTQSPLQQLLMFRQLELKELRKVSPCSVMTLLRRAQL
jgi:hypothetical protein